MCEEFTGPPWIPRTKASDAELWCFLWCAWIKDWLNNREAGDLRRNRGFYDVSVMWTGVGVLLIGYLEADSPWFCMENYAIFYKEIEFRNVLREKVASLC